MVDERQGGFSLRDVSDGAEESCYVRMTEALRTFLDDLAGAAPDDRTTDQLADDLATWSSRLRRFSVREADQMFARQNAVAGRGQTMAPKLTFDEVSDSRARGRVVFGRYFLGGNGAVHGGAIPLLFDEIMGRLANGGRTPARTAFIHVDYRSITPIEKPLILSAWFENEEGRKRLLRGELREGSTLCAEAHGLFVELKPGQP